MIGFASRRQRRQPVNWSWFMRLGSSSDLCGIVWDLLRINVKSIYCRSSGDFDRYVPVLDQIDGGSRTAQERGWCKIGLASIWRHPGTNSESVWHWLSIGHHAIRQGLALSLEHRGFGYTGNLVQAQKWCWLIWLFGGNTIGDGTTWGRPFQAVKAITKFLCGLGCELYWLFLKLLAN